MAFVGLSSALYELGEKHHQAGRLQEAEHAYRQVLAQDPRHFPALHMMGMLAGQIGRPELSLEFTDQALAVRSDVAEAHANRGTALAMLGRDAEAEVSFRKALALKPGYPQAMQGLEALKKRAADAASAPD